VHACPGGPAAQPRHQGPGGASEEPWQERKADHLRGDAQAAAYRLRGAQIRSALRSRTGGCEVAVKTVSTGYRTRSATPNLSSTAFGNDALRPSFSGMS